MAIRDIFKMIKADRYTQDGREELIKAQEAVTEDVTYKPGDISRKTGLQKQPDGSWAPVKNAPAQSKKMDKAKQSEIAKQAEFEKTVGDPAKARADYWKEINEASQKPMPGVEELYNKTVGKESASGSGVPTQGSDWMSLPSGTRMTFEGAKEKMVKNNERIETIKKMMEGKSKADNFRLGSELKSLQNENEYIAERLPPEKTESSSASGALKEQTPEEIQEIGRAGRAWRESLKKDAEERQAEVQKALAEQMKKEANSSDIKIRGMDKDKYIFNTMMERHIPREKAEESWNQEVERVQKLRAESSAPTESDRLDAEVGLHEGEENLPDFVKGYSILSEEHGQDARASNAKMYPSLQPLVKQREPFMKKRIEAFTKLRDNPSNPKARADFVDASNAIAQIDADIDREYKKATGDSAPRILTGDCKIRIKKSK